MFKRLKTLLLPVAILAAVFGGVSANATTLPDLSAGCLAETRVGGYQLFDATPRQVQTAQASESQQATAFSWYDTASECSVAAKNAGYHATKPQNAPYIMEQGVRSSAGGRLGEGVYVSDTVEGAIAEYNAHNPGLRLKPAIIEVEYTPGVNLKVTPPSQYYEGPLPFTQGAGSLTAPSVRVGGTVNTVIRNGTAVPVRRVQ